MSNNTNTLGTVVTFTAEGDNDIALRPSKVSRDECRVIGLDYYNAVADNDTKTINKMLANFGGILVRRSLLVFANYASRVGEPEVAKAAKSMRNEITKVRKSA